jgi:hypothetical protein
MYLLAEAMREYLDWDAKSLVNQESYLKYPVDWTTTNNLDEAAEFAKSTDMFIFSDLLRGIEGMDLEKLVGPKNCIISGQGTPMRAQMPQLLQMQLEGWAILAPTCDPTIARFLGGAPFENWIVPTGRISTITHEIDLNDEITICHAPTKAFRKGTDEIEAIMKNDFPDIKYELITGKSWEDAIRAKAKCHIMWNSLHDSSYGVGNALEGLAIGQEVVSNITPWDYAMHPDLPMLSTWNKDVVCVIKDAIRQAERRVNADSDEENYETYGRKWEWVSRHFNAEYQIVKWKHYIDWVMNRKVLIET